MTNMANFLQQGLTDISSIIFVVSESQLLYLRMWFAFIAQLITEHHTERRNCVILQVLVCIITCNILFSILHPLPIWTGTTFTQYNAYLHQFCFISYYLSANTSIVYLFCTVTVDDLFFIISRLSLLFIAP